MADYWIKLYHEILDDPKMATLPDRLWRRTIEIFLLAGKLSTDKSGQLPETNQLAWLLRMSTDDLSMDMSQLSNAGIIQKTQTGWIVTNFEKRQAAVSDAERKKQQRERDNKNKYYGTNDVTELSRNVTQINRIQNTETESETKTNTTSSSNDEFSKLVREYEQNIGAITQKTNELLSDDFEQYGYQLCSKAITEAIRKNKRNWSYVQGILKNWWANGYMGDGQPKNGKKTEYKEQWKDGQLIFVPIEEVVNES